MCIRGEDRDRFAAPSGGGMGGGRADPFGGARPRDDRSSLSCGKGSWKKTLLWNGRPLVLVLRSVHETLRLIFELATPYLPQASLSVQLLRHSSHCWCSGGVWVRFRFQAVRVLMFGGIPLGNPIASKVFEGESPCPSTVRRVSE